MEAVAEEHQEMRPRPAVEDVRTRTGRRRNCGAYWFACGLGLLHLCKRFWKWNGIDIRA